MHFFEFPVPKCKGGALQWDRWSSWRLYTESWSYWFKCHSFRGPKNNCSSGHSVACICCFRWVLLMIPNKIKEKNLISLLSFFLYSLYLSLAMFFQGPWKVVEQTGLSRNVLYVFFYLWNVENLLYWTLHMQWLTYLLSFVKELGASSVTPLLTVRSPTITENRVDRLRRVVLAAVKQCNHYFCFLPF